LSQTIIVVELDYTFLIEKKKKGREKENNHYSLDNKKIYNTAYLCSKWYITANKRNITKKQSTFLLWMRSMLCIFCSGLAYYIQGPVFITAFSPLCMVIVAVMSSIILAQQMYLERYLSRHVLDLTTSM
jgi:hypothetical protein